MAKCITGLWKRKNFTLKVRILLSLNKFVTAQLCWLLNSIPGAASEIHLPKVHFKTDACILGWGTKDGDNQTGGFGQVMLHPAI